MAAGGLLALLDDIAAVLDDVAIMSKVAIKKTAGIAGDDLAVGASTVTGADPSRELPVVWAVAKGSLINKFYLVPGALLLNAVAPFLIQPILMAGGVFFCYEAVEKIIHARAKKKPHKKMTEAFLKGEKALLDFERKKIKSAIQTDLVLSAEIVAVTLGAVAAAPFATQAAVLSAIALLMTVGIYGLVAAIVKLDDAGLYLSRRKGRFTRRAGLAMVRAAPQVMRFLSVIGTAAMILVGGELILHGLPPAAHALHEAPGWAKTAAAIVTGLAVGFAAVPAVKYGGLWAAKVLSMISRKKSRRR